MAMIFNIFTKSPFGSIQEMMNKVIKCAGVVDPMIDAFISEDTDKVKKDAELCSKLEYEADKIKDEIRLNMPRSILMPVAREDILHILSAQDSIADVAEDIGILVSIKKIRLPDEIKEKLREFKNKAVDVVKKSGLVVEKLEILRESSFGGPAVEEITKLLDDVNIQEHHTDKLQFALTKSILDYEDKFNKAEFILMLKIVENIGGLANAAEKMCNRIRLILAR